MKTLPRPAYLVPLGSEAHLELGDRPLHARDFNDAKTLVRFCQDD